jgi:hypothetical protein
MAAFAMGPGERAMVDWNPYGVPLAVSGILLGALAAVTFFSRPSARQNQSLGMLLASVAAMSTSVAIAYLTEDPKIAVGGYAVLFAAWFTLMVAQLRFAASFQVPWLAFLRLRIVDWTLLAVFFLGPVIHAVWLLPRTFSGVISYEPYVPWRPFYYPGAYETWSYLVTATSFIVLMASLDAWRRAPVGTPLKRKLATYLVASSVIEGIAITTTLLRADIVNTLAAGGNIASWKVPAFLISAIALFFTYVVGIGYAILKAQVFDIDLKIKWGLRRGTVAGFLVGVFFVGSQLVENVTNAQFGLVGGSVVAGLAIFALRPVSRLVDRIADRAMPGVENTEEYVRFRKLQVYQTALDEMLLDGVLSAKDERVLAALGKQLGVAGPVLNRLRADALALRA